MEKVVLGLGVLFIFSICGWLLKLYLQNKEKYHGSGWFFNFMADIGEKIVFRK